MTFHSFISLTVTLFRVLIGHIVGHSILGVEDKNRGFLFSMYAWASLAWEGRMSF